MTAPVFILLLAAHTVAPPEWCARALELSSGAFSETGEQAPDALERMDKTLALLPPAATPVVAQVRALAGEDGSLRKAWEVLAAAVTDTCVPRTHVDAAAALSARARALMADDPRFGGVRQGDDALDRLLHKLWLSIAKLLESEGMQQYAGNARVVYFVVLLAFVLAVAFRVLRALARTRGDEAAARVAAAVEARRKRAFAAWRKDAEALLASGDARGALRAGQGALLARIGELDEKAVTPARTHREIVGRLGASVAEVVSPALRTFDASFFGKDATLDDARGFLALVDDAERRLQPSTRGPSAREPSPAVPG